MLLTPEEILNRDDFSVCCHVSTYLLICDVLREIIQSHFDTSISHSNPQFVFDAFYFVVVFVVICIHNSLCDGIISYLNKGTVVGVADLQLYQLSTCHAKMARNKRMYLFGGRLLWKVREVHAERVFTVFGGCHLRNALLRL